MGENAVNSFKHFHPDIEVYTLKKTKNLSFKKIEGVSVPIKRMMFAYEVFLKNKLDKLIFLGADTITTAYLSEFVDNNDYDILTSLDYAYQFRSKYVVSPDNETHVNVDVGCYNNPDVIKEIIKLTNEHPNEYMEQGALNELLWGDSKKFTFKIVDYPYNESRVIYNVRSKGYVVAQPNTKPWQEHTRKFYIKDGLLYADNDKQIKVWHYCQGFGCQSENDISIQLYLWTNEYFNKETVVFFKSIGCTNYFGYST